MATLNGLSCGSSILNTGIVSCTFDLKEVIGSILIPKGKTYTKEEIATWQASLIADANADAKKERIYPIGRFEAITDNSEDAVSETLGYGGQYFLRDGQYRFQFRVLNGSKCFHTQLRSFTGQENKFDILFVDKQQAVMGTIVIDKTTGEPTLGGYTLSQIYVPKVKFPDGSAGAMYLINFILADESQLNDRFGFVKEETEPFDVLKEVLGMLDISLQNLTPSGATAGTKTIALLSGCGSQSLVDLFATELAAPSLWKVTNAATGGDITVTSVTAAASGFILVLDTSDTDYPTGTQQLSITLVTPSALAAADVVSPEGNKFEAQTIKIAA